MGATRKTIEEYKKQASEIHNNKYSYDNWVVLSKYHDKIPITCSTHGTFFQTLANHITAKAGCPTCRKDLLAGGVRSLSKEEWISRAHAIHHQKYQYVFPSTFSNADVDAVAIICPLHGEFTQRLSDHVRKKAGCPKCAKHSQRATNRQRHGTDHHAQSHMSPDVLSKLNDVEWLTTQHHSLNRTIEHIANELQVQDTTVGRYFRAHSIQVLRFPRSVGEQEIGQFLVNNGVRCIFNDRATLGGREIDILLPDHDMAIEYCGLYWHSDKHKHPLYHHQKLVDCAQKNIRLLTVYEDEWRMSPLIVQQTLLYLLKIDTRQKVNARECGIVDVTPTHKKIFLDTHHIQGSGPGSITIGLMYKQEIVAMMSFIRQQNNTFILNRYATSCRVRGGFSKLMSHFKKTHKWSTITTFADLRWSDGKLYEQYGFKCDKILPPDYYYSPNGHTRSHKFNYRRKNLPNLLNAFDSTKSEKQNCDDNGVLRIWDCGKKRYVLTNTKT